MLSLGSLSKLLFKKFRTSVGKSQICMWTGVIAVLPLDALAGRRTQVLPLRSPWGLLLFQSLNPWVGPPSTVSSAYEWDFSFPCFFWGLLTSESQGQRRLVGYRLWGGTVRHNWSDLAEAATLEQLFALVLYFRYPRVYLYILQFVITWSIPQ